MKELLSTDDFNEGAESINSFDGYASEIKVNSLYAIYFEYLKCEFLYR